jgi:hypothetical protein
MVSRVDQLAINYQSECNAREMMFFRVPAVHRINHRE